ncbi:MAG: RNA polymerase sigma factor [Steroidobacteraceae bacterium]
MNEALNQWFIREVLVHERALVRFMARVWPDRYEIEDLCHETYIRVYEAAAKALPTSPRGFLFATARHLMADRVRRSRIVSIESRGDLDSLNVLIDDISPERRVSAREELWRLAEAFGALPAKCRQVVWLLKVEGLTRREVAERLKLTPKAVEKRIERGIRLLEAYFGEKGVDDAGWGVDDAGSKDAPLAEMSKP